MVGDQFVAIHRFVMGDRVTVQADRSNSNVRPGINEIVRTMPKGSEGLQYRAKNVLDDHERVFLEVELVKA